MRKNWIFDCKSQLEAVLAWLDGHKTERGARTTLAKAAGCQGAHVSQVLSGKVQWTPEQAAGLCDLWSLGKLETDYFMNLVHLARAGTPLLRDQLKLKLADIRSAHENTLKSEISVEVYDKEKITDYYLDWVVSAVHALLTVPEYQDPKAISRRLAVDDHRIQKGLNVLSDLGFIFNHQGKYKLTSQHIYAADQSRYASLHHRNWRLQAEQDLQRPAKNQRPAFHYTGIHALSVEDFERVKAELQKAIENCRDIVRPSKEETVICTAIDCMEIDFSR